MAGTQGSESSRISHVKAEKLARMRQRELLKPPGSLGRLEELAIQMARAQRTEWPRARPASALLFASDHPVYRHGVSAYPQETTAAMVSRFALGGAASTTLARALRIPLHVVDVGVAHPYDAVPNAAGDVCVTRDAAANAPAGDLRIEDAMSPETYAAARQAGCEAVERLPSDTRLVLLGEMGIANTTPASAVCAHLTHEPVDRVVGPGTGLDPAGLQRKRSVVQDALQRVGPASPDEALRRLGGRELAALAAAMARGAELGMVLVIDGFIVSAAAAVALAANPEIRPFLIFSHRSLEPGHGALLGYLDVSPLLDLNMRLGEGTGALTAFPLIELACILHCEMATFSDAGLSRAAG